MNLDEDEDELRRLENIDKAYMHIPFTDSNLNNEKQKQQLNIKLLESMRCLLNNKTALLSDNVANSFKDLWSPSMNKDQRQALYRYWLFKYVRWLIG